MSKRISKRMSKRISIMILCALFLLAACASVQKEVQIFSYEELDAHDEALARRIVEAHNSFGFDLFTLLAEEEAGENLFISPLSMAMALTMTLNGAAAETTAAMSKVLHLDGFTEEEFNRANQILKSILENVDDEVVLHMANSLWGRQGETFLEGFVHRNEEFFDASLHMLDFAEDGAADLINAWVEEQTNGRIEEMIEKPIDPQAILFLINAMYFNAGWSTPFDKERTVHDHFFLGDQGMIRHPFMRQGGSFSYLAGEGFTALKLPYGEKEQLQAYFFLPDEDSSLREFQEQLSPSQWQQWQEGFTKQEGAIALPTFELEYEKSLNDILKALGMEIAFDEQRANFGRMTPITPIAPNVFINEVKHKTYVHLNEEGTEAAGVTVVEMVRGSASLDYFDFTLNRPFYFSIVDDLTGSILFMGSIVEPF